VFLEFAQNGTRRGKIENGNSIRVLLVDDHQFAREGLKRMLELDSCIKVVGEAVNGHEAVAQAEVLSPDVILMDIKMPGGDGIEATRLLKEKEADCRIIMLTLYEEYLSEAMKAGAVGYLLKDVKRDELVHAVRAAHEGRVPLSALSKEPFAEFTASAGDADQVCLAERELQILRLIAEGFTSKEIGAQLFLTETTVKRIVQRIFEKIDVHSRSEAIAQAFKRKLI
jgi:DNA-binding NarL/FixJ family response regulator